MTYSTSSWAPLVPKPPSAGLKSCLIPLLLATAEAVEALVHGTVIFLLIRMQRRSLPLRSHLVRFLFSWATIAGARFDEDGIAIYL